MWAAGREANRQRRPLLRALGALRVEQAVGVVVAPGHPARTHCTGHPEQNARHERLHLTLKIARDSVAPEFAGRIEGIPDAVR